MSAHSVSYEDRDPAPHRSSFLKHLFVATDGMADGDRAVGYAIALATRHESDVVLCHAANPISALGESAGGRGDEHVLTEALARMKSAGIVATAEQRHGSPSDVILDRACDGSFDALIMGTRGECGLRRVIDGSVADDVVRRAGIPVFVVPLSAQSSHANFDRVLVAVDDAGSSDSAMEFALAFVRAGNARLVVCSVAPGDALPNIDFERLAETGDPALEILRAAVKHGADCIVLGTHGRQGPRRWLLGSVAETVARMSSVPVAIVRR